MERLNHEYWPWWFIYLPVVPLYLYQAIRQRRVAFFTNVNPAMDMGGFFGESKSDIYSLLPEASYPRTVVVPAHSTSAIVIDLRSRTGLSFPLVLKPDVGERGRAVRIVHEEREMVEQCALCKEDMLLQQLVSDPAEFSLFFVKDPATGRTDLLSITGKRFLNVVGDGQRTVGELLNGTTRGARQTRRLARMVDLQRTPEEGEHVLLEPIGNHCRGTAFFDASHLATPALRVAVQALLASTNGLYYGRFDVRSAGDAALREGRFTVIELNGVSSEPGHIYDADRSIWWCWRELLRHVRHIGTLSGRLQRMGYEPATVVILIRRCAQHFWGWQPFMAPTLANASSRRLRSPRAITRSRGIGDEARQV